MKHVLLIFLFCLSFTGVSGNIYFRHLSKSEGLSQISVVSICQDEVGRMWFGTLEGLNCYDGHEMTVYRPANVPDAPFLGNEIHDLVSDRRGNLFFTSDGKLIHYDLYEERFMNLQLRASCLCAGFQGEVWTAVRDSLLRWDRTERRFVFMGKMPEGKQITCLHAHRDRGLWIGTYSGLYYMKGLSGKNVPVSIIPDANIYSLYVDSKNRLWVATYRKGMYCIRRKTDGQLEITDRFTLPSNDVRCFVEDDQGSIWIGTYNGLSRLNTDGQTICYKQTGIPGSLSHSSIFSLFKDRQGGIWVGTYYGGVDYFHPDMDYLKHYSSETNVPARPSYSYVGNMVEDKRGDIWICTEGGGLNRWHRKTDTFTYYLTDSFPNMKCIAYDKENDCLYIGTHKKGALRLDIASGQVIRYVNNGGSFNDLLMKGDSLYLVSEQGLFLKLRGSDKWIRPYPTVIETKESGVALCMDQEERLWISLRHAVISLAKNNPQDTIVYRLGTHGLGRFMVTKMAESPDGTLFFGTSGSGLYRLDKTQKCFIKCIVPDAEYIYNMKFHNSGYLIMSTDAGVVCYHPATGDVKMLDASQLHLSTLNDGCGLLIDRNNEIWVGGTNGMTAFYFPDLFIPSADYHLYFSQLYVNGHLLSAYSSKGLLRKALPFASDIELAHDENNLVFSFSTDNYMGHYGQKQYEFRMEGLDKEWQTTHTPKIVYTNLSPGHYRLRIKEKGPGSNGKIHEASLSIMIHAPWWATWWAYTLYVGVFLLTGGAIVRNRLARMRLRASLAQEKMEKAQNEELLQAKLQFFANISHEFRTPLTLIMTQLETLSQTAGLSPYVRGKLQKIYKNTYHFRELISELLDFRKLERGKLTLRISRNNLVEYLREICEEFQEQARLLQIRLNFQSEAKELFIWYDARQLRKVFTNLLSNALKFTPANGSVEMIVTDKGNEIEIKVMDSGEGIPEKSLPYIFDRFYQAKTNESSASSGIGLALAKGIVELHHGTISVQSVLGYGSVFTVCLAKENPFANDENVTYAEAGEAEEYMRRIPFAEEPAKEETVHEKPAQETNPPTGESGEKESVLLVEDNEELLSALTDLFAPFYRVSLALNGKEGLAKAMDEQPDLIVSDVMMPEMSGTEMCRKLKSDFDLCHIPVLLLTALTSDESKMEGLQCGADEYVEKPFNNKLLLGTVANLLRNRRLLKQKFGSTASAPDTFSEKEASLPLTLNPIDANFVKRLEYLVKDRLSDSELDIDRLAHELGISRSSFYNKVKALMQMTPNEYILKVRLEYAAGMLKTQPGMQITEIAYQSGFNSLRYFRQCFKARYGLTPLEYRQKGT